MLAPSLKSTNNPVKRLENELVKNKIPVYFSRNEEDGLDEDVIKGKVAFTTFHQSKGRERKIVFVFGFDNSYQCNYEIWGSKGKLFLHRAFTPKPNETTKITIEKDGTTNLIDLPCDNHFKNILIEFYKSIIERNFDKHYDDILIQSNLISQVKSVAKLYYI